MGHNVKTATMSGRKDDYEESQSKSASNDVDNHDLCQIGFLLMKILSLKNYSVMTHTHTERWGGEGEGAMEK